MTAPERDSADIDEKALRMAISHLRRWHWIATSAGFLMTWLTAFILVHFIGRIGWVQDTVLSAVDALPFVTTANRIEVVLFVLGALALLFLTGVGMGIASDISRTQIIGRINQQPRPVALAEAMKTRLRARSGRLEQQYRFFPKHASDGRLQPNGLYVGIGTIAPFWVLMVFFLIYFRW